MTTFYDQSFSWETDEFEDMVASTLIACFETKFKKNRGAAPPDRLNDERIAVIRAEGPFIPGPGSTVAAPNDQGQWFCGIELDRLPVKGMYAMKPHGKVAEGNPNSYLEILYFKQAGGLGKNWKIRKQGVLYEIYSMSVRNDGVFGDRRFFTVTPKGEVLSCLNYVNGAAGAGIGAGSTIITPSDYELECDTVWSAAALQFVAGRRQQWVITASEDKAKAHLGCMQEEVKSLLYARSLPLSSTGRKRPILHLVESHKRRLKSGIEIDITPFLRGQQVIEMNGTTFKVNPPAVVKPLVSKPSQVRFFEKENENAPV